MCALCFSQVHTVFFQDLIVTSFSLFILVGFGTAHDKSQATPTLSPSTHHTFAPTLTQRRVTQTCKAGKGQQPAVVGLGLGSSWGETAMNGLVLSVNLNGLPSIWAGGVGYEGSVVGACMCEGVPSCRHAVCQVQHYNSGWIVWPACLFCPSKEERSCAPFHLRLVSLTDMQHSSSIQHLTCLSGNQGVRAQRLMKRAAASLGAPLPTMLAWTTAFEGVVDILTADFFPPF